MLDWKIILAVVAALLLLTGGLVKDVATGIDGDFGKDMEGLFDNVLKKLSNVFEFSPDLSVPVNRKVNVEAKLENYSSFEFENTDSDRITMSYNPDDMNITADSNSIDVEGNPSELEVSQYTGEITVSDSSLELDGNADVVSSGAVRINGKNLKLNVDGDFSEVSFQGIVIDELKLEDMAGELDANSKVSVSVDNNPTTLEAFKGNLTFTGDEMEIKGVSKRVSSMSDGFSITLNS